MEEYKILRPFIQRFYNNNDIKIIKRKSPDFIVMLENGVKVGIEITKFIDATGAVINKLASDNFGRAKSTKEIMRIAVQKYPKIHKKIKINQLSNGVTSIGRNTTINITNEHLKNAEQIITKYKKFKQWSIKEHYDERIILCESETLFH